MKRISIFLAAGVGLWLMPASADGQEKEGKDANIRKMLIGKWAHEITSKELSHTMNLTVNKDGTFALFGKFKIEVGKEKTSFSFKYAGTWKVADGKIEMTIRTSDDPDPLPEGGRLESLPVIEINEMTLKVGKAGALGEFREFKRMRE